MFTLTFIYDILKFNKWRDIVIGICTFVAFDVITIMLLYIKLN